MTDKTNGKDEFGGLAESLELMTAKELELINDMNDTGDMDDMGDLADLEARADLFDLDTVEKELAELIGNDKASWVRIYELMHTVEQNRLYDVAYRSFTAWVNDFATKSKVHVSLLWNRLKAGKMYARYEARARAAGRETTSLADLSASPDSLILIEKISQGNAAVADELTEKVIKGDLGRADLKNAWATVRADKNARVRVNAHDRHDASKKEQADSSGAAPGNPAAMTAMTAMTAKDIVLAICKQAWLPNPIEKAFQKPKFRVLTEFAIQTPTAHHARRIDALVLENSTPAEKETIAVHGIEIKVSKSDLLNDHKMQEYCDYVDYFWVAVPEELLDYAQSIALPTWGILTMDETGELRVVMPARHVEAPWRYQTIESALMKLL